MCCIFFLTHIAQRGGQWITFQLHLHHYFHSLISHYISQSNSLILPTHPIPDRTAPRLFFLNHKGRNMRGTAECRGACQWMHLQLHDVDDLNTMLHACAMGYHPQSSIARTCTAVRRLISSHGIHSQAMFTVSCNADVHTECLKWGWIKCNPMATQWHLYSEHCMPTNRQAKMQDYKTTEFQCQLLTWLSMPNW